MPDHFPEERELSRIIARVKILPGVVNTEHSLNELYDHVRAALWEITVAEKVLGSANAANPGEGIS